MADNKAGNTMFIEEDLTSFVDNTQDYTCCDINSDNETNHSQNTEGLQMDIHQDSPEYFDDSQDTYCDIESDNERNQRENIEDALVNNSKQKKITQTANNDSDEKKISPAINSEDDQVQNSKNCIHCVFDKELDKRNYYFGNLLIGELQFLPPCMRSKAYIEILKYVDSLKKKHRDEHN